MGEDLAPREKNLVMEMSCEGENCSFAALKFDC